MRKRLMMVVAGHVALYVALLALAYLAFTSAHYLAALVTSVQLTLVAIWVGLSRAPWPLRILATILAIPGFSLLSALAYGALFRQQTSQWVDSLILIGRLLAVSHATALSVSQPPCSGCALGEFGSFDRTTRPRSRRLPFNFRFGSS